MAEPTYTEDTMTQDAAQLRDQLTTRTLPDQRLADALLAAAEAQATQTGCGCGCWNFLHLGHCLHLA